MKIRFGLIFVAIAVFSSSALADLLTDDDDEFASGDSGADDFVIVAVHLDQTMDPKSVGDSLSECLNNSTCKDVAVGLASGLGVNEKQLKTAVAGIKSDFSGEEGHLTYNLPHGYRYCSSSVKVISVVPMDGRRASVLGVRAYDTFLGVYTWTPRRNPGEGRSWVEADFSIVGVKANKAADYFASGKCRRAQERLLLSCRGNDGGDLPPCKSVED